MELVFLGTSCMQPTKERNHPGMYLGYEGEGILFDCGEGVQRQLKIAGIKAAKIKKILITHWHGDHVFGLPGLMQSMSAGGYSGILEIYGPKGSSQFLRHMLKGFASKEVMDYVIKEVERGVFFDGEGYCLEAEEMDHSTPCVGFSFTEKDKRKINLSYVRKMGIAEGPLLGKLQMGKSIIFKGKKVKVEDATKLVKGRKVTYITDTRPCSNAVKLAKNSEILVMESTYKSDLEEKAEEYKHMTAKETALIANQANVKKLILVHFSTRYKNVQELEEDARDIFDNTEAAEDFKRIRL